MSESSPKIYFFRGLHIILYPTPRQKNCKKYLNIFEPWDQWQKTLMEASEIQHFIQVDQWKEDTKHHACGHLVEPPKGTVALRQQWPPVGWLTSTGWSVYRQRMDRSNVFSPPARWGLLDFIRAAASSFRLLLLLLLLLASSCRRTSTTAILAKCWLPDLNHGHPSPVLAAGPQPRPAPPSVGCRTSTTAIPAQCWLPDLNHHVKYNARDNMSDRMLEDMSDRMSDRYNVRYNVRHNVRRYVRYNVR